MNRKEALQIFLATVLEEDDTLHAQAQARWRALLPPPTGRAPNFLSMVTFALVMDLAEGDTSPDASRARAIVMMRALEDMTNDGYLRAHGVMSSPTMAMLEAVRIAQSLSKE